MKKGVTQVDWAVSLGIFILYLIWFFVLVRPLFLPTVTEDPFVDNVFSGIKSYHNWDLDKLPIIYRTNLTKEYYPIYLDFPYNWSSSSIAFSDSNNFFLSEGRLFFLKNISNSTIISYMLHSSDSYTQPNVLYDITSTEKAAIVTGMRAEFNSSMLKSIHYMDVPKLLNFSLFVNNIDISNYNSSYSTSRFLARYKLIGAALNHSSYVFGHNTAVHNFFDLKQIAEGSYNVSMDVELYPYDNYFINNRYFSFINYSLNMCENFTKSFVDFYDDEGGIAFIFDSTRDFSICYHNTSKLLFSTQFSLTNKSVYKIILHNETYKEVEKQNTPYSYDYGIIEKQTGISQSTLFSLDTTNYRNLRRKFGLPSTSDFTFEVINLTDSATLFNYASVNNGLFDNVYVEERKDFLLDSESNNHRIKIRVKSW